MKVLFIMRHSGYARLFDSTLEGLCNRGHEVVVAKGKEARYLRDRPTALTRLEERTESFSLAALPPESKAGWGQVARQLRAALDGLRFLGEEYHDSPKLRARGLDRAPVWVQALLRIPGMRTPRGGRFLTRLLVPFERAVPWNAAIEKFIADVSPDVVVVTPLLDIGSSQPCHVRAARALGVPVVLAVASWDNLTNKGLIREQLDAVLVWNEWQRREAIEMHGISADRIVATGAQAFDHWFSWEPSTGPEEFRGRIGLPADDRKLILYLCSSPFIAPDETGFVTRWLAHIRGSADPQLSRSAVLIRPHPQNAKQWEDVEFPGDDAVVVHPRGGADPVDADKRREYFDSIYHCCAVVGINSSSLIESAIVRRPVLTVLAPEFRDTQTGTLHFDYLRAAGGGLLTIARDLDQHEAQIRSVLAGNAAVDGHEDFLRAFVRPFGCDEPATPRVVAEIERVASAQIEPARPTPATRVLRALMSPLAWRSARAST